MDILSLFNALTIYPLILMEISHMHERWRVFSICSNKQFLGHSLFCSTATGRFYSVNAYLSDSFERIYLITGRDEVEGKKKEKGEINIGKGGKGQIKPGCCLVFFSKLFPMTHYSYHFPLNS